MSLLASVVIPTYNPNESRLARTLSALSAQSLSPTLWETILVNNTSTSFPHETFFTENAPRNLRIVEESHLGLSFARNSGLNHAKADVVIFVDDDNLLAPDYIENALKLMSAHPDIGALAGRIVPEFESPPPPWITEFNITLACSDRGSLPLVSSPHPYDQKGQLQYPWFSPVGAGMVLRRAGWEIWQEAFRSGTALSSDRTGNQLTSGGDNEIILILLKAGWQVGYFPSLSLTHLIPKSRLDPNYLARLNFGCSFGFIQALRRHDACPSSPIPRWTLPLRLARAWFRCRAWRGPANRIRWRGLAGHFTALVR